MSVVDIRTATAADAPLIADMLGQLADDLGDGDVFASSADIIQKHGFGTTPLFQVLLAETGGQAVGFALYFAHFSTTKGLPGVYVQDLWIDPKKRGAGIGETLLAAVANHAATAWSAGYMKLSVHADNPGAERFYRRLGFSVAGNETPMMADCNAFSAVQGAT